MVKNEEMHYIDSDDQGENVGVKKTDNKWVVIQLYFISLFAFFTVKILYCIRYI